MNNRNSETDITAGRLMAQMMRKRERGNLVTEKEQQQFVNQSVRQLGDACTEFSIGAVKYKAKEKTEPDWAEAERCIQGWIETLQGMIQYKKDFEPSDTECRWTEEKMKALHTSVLALRRIQEIEKQNLKAD